MAALSTLHNQPGSGFNWSDYDNRANAPNFNEDMSDFTSPDNKIDYIAFIYRWAPQPAVTTTTGLAPTYVTGSYDGYSFSSIASYVQFRGDYGIYWTFIHEVGHYLNNMPHYGGANGVVGNYFYGNMMWGEMNLNSSRPFCIENTCVNVPSAVQPSYICIISLPSISFNIMLTLLASGKFTMIVISFFVGFG